MIGERKLRKWRQEALKAPTKKEYFNSTSALVARYLESQDRILELTQELLDQHLIRRAS